MEGSIKCHERCADPGSAVFYLDMACHVLQVEPVCIQRWASTWPPCVCGLGTKLTPFVYLMEAIAPHCIAPGNRAVSLEAMTCKEPVLLRWPGQTPKLQDADR